MEIEFLSWNSFRLGAILASFDNEYLLTASSRCYWALTVFHWFKKPMKRRGLNISILFCYQMCWCFWSFLLLRCYTKFVIHHMMQITDLDGWVEGPLAEKREAECNIHHYTPILSRNVLETHKTRCLKLNINVLNDKNMLFSWIFS